MIELLYPVMAVEMAVVLALIFKTPLRNVVILGLDKLKRGRGPVMVKTVGLTVTVVLFFSVYSVVKIQNRASENNGSGLNTTDQVLMSTRLLEASLMGFLLFLALTIDRLHHYIRELRLLRKTMETAKKQNRSSDDLKNVGSEGLKSALDSDISTLKAKIKKLESECESKSEAAKAAEAETEARKKQSEGFLMEYDHLVEENQSLRSQLESIGHGNKKSI